MIFFREFKHNPGEIVNKRKLGQGQAVQKFVDSEVIRRMSPYTPFRDGALVGSATGKTSVGSGKVQQQTPYAKRWYYEPANFNGAPMRGNRWFERMKQSHKADILRGAAAIAGAKTR